MQHDRWRCNPGLQAQFVYLELVLESKVEHCCYEQKPRRLANSQAFGCVNWLFGYAKRCQFYDRSRPLSPAAHRHLPQQECIKLRPEIISGAVDNRLLFVRL